MDLLSNCTSGGCGAKIGPGELSQLLSPLQNYPDKQLIVGYDTKDDAAVYQISLDTAIVSTVDFFSPMVNDPFLFGKIAAANALSDIYAMGAKPLFALNLVCFPHKMPKEVLGQILAGGAEKLQEAQVPLAGGHSIYDHEIKYGLSVTGQAHPNQLLRNNAPKAGDCLILTKPLGVGIVLAAARAQMATQEHISAATASMERLNRYAAEIAANFEIHACTDITGFGLLGHLCEMLGEEHGACLDCNALPLLPGALQYAEEYCLTAAGQRNRQHIESLLSEKALQGVTFPIQELLFDPQTSGGLLLSVKGDEAAVLLEKLRQTEPNAAIIGRVLERNSKDDIVSFT